MTIDAMGCQKDIAKEIVSLEANFEEYNIDFAETFDKGHGRLESRRCWVSYDALPHIDGSENWEGLQTIVMVES